MSARNATTAATPTTTTPSSGNRVAASAASSAAAVSGQPVASALGAMTATRTAGGIASKAAWARGES